MDNNKNEKAIPVGDVAELSIDAILAEFKAEEQVEALEYDQSQEQGSPPVPENEVLPPVDAEPFPPGEPDFSLDEGLFDRHTPTSAEELLVYDELGDTRPLRDSLRPPVAAEDAGATVVFEKIPRTDEEALWSEGVDSRENREQYAPNRSYARDDSEAEETNGRGGGNLLAPLLGLLASASEKRLEKRRAELEREKAAPLPPELSPEKAARLYLDQAASMRLRCLFASFLSLVLVWLGYNFPAMGILGTSAQVRTLVSLILLLVTMVVGLDVITSGLLSLIRKRPGPESLITVSCLASIADAVYILVSGNTDDGLPFCAVAALSVTFALWGAYLNCRSFALSFITAARAKNPSVVLSASGGENQGRVLTKAQRPVTGFVRKSEEADVFERAFRLASPLLLVFSLVLSLFAFLASEKCDNFLHTLSAALAVSASFSAVLGFALPFYVLTKRLARSGAAIAGYAGCAELGHINQVVIKDRDVFPARTLSIANVTVSEGFYPDKVVSYTASMISAAGMGVAAVFTELMKKNAYTMQKVEDFACHEGGGILARINGDKVYIGSSSFMQLMSIRVGKGTGSSTAVYTAINDTLAGVFEVSYVPVASVQKGLVTLLRGRTEPVFAVRDFNITPMLIKQKFRLPKESYDFPSFADRYAISSSETEEKGSVAGMFTRGGLNAVGGLVKRGKVLYNGLLLCVVLSVFGAFVGMLLMLALCWSGAYASASCGNAVTFMLLWLVPVLVTALGLRR